MERLCKLDEYWHELINQCIHCKMECQEQYIIPRCTYYCEITNCKAIPGHYYDGLLKRCVECAEVCGNHPEECTEYCTISKTPIASTKLLAGVTSPVLYSRVPSAAEDSTIMLYTVLGVCMLMLFTSLTLAVIVLLRRATVKKTTIPAPQANGNSDRERVKQIGLQVVQTHGPTWQSSKEFVTKSNCRTDQELLDDSSPTETCIHCFPDLKAISHDRPVKAPVPLNPQTAHHGSLIQKGGSLSTGGFLDTCGQGV